MPVPTALSKGSLGTEHHPRQSGKPRCGLGPSSFCGGENRATTYSVSSHGLTRRNCGSAWTARELAHTLTYSTHLNMTVHQCWDKLNKGQLLQTDFRQAPRNRPVRLCSEASQPSTQPSTHTVWDLRSFTRAQAKVQIPQPRPQCPETWCHLEHPYISSVGQD